MTERYVSCPRCKKEILYSTDNIYRPFCSERCKVIDLGDWASESFRIPISENIPEASDENDENQGSSEDLD